MEGGFVCREACKIRAKGRSARQAGTLAFAGGVLDQLTILAPGLLGGSVARAAHARGLAGRIVIWARRPETRRQLREQPWCQAAPDTVEEAARGANLVVIAAPVTLIAPLAAQIARATAKGMVRAG